MLSTEVKTEPLETLHIYFEREEEKKPFVFLPLLFAMLCLLEIVAVTVYSWEHPSFEHETLTTPAHFFTRTFVAAAPIIPTGRKTYPATTAHGILTITNGSVISQTIPKGFTVDGVVTDSGVYVPAGSANGYGYATVAAHALLSGQVGNFATLAINQVEGSSVYIRNLQPFTGGQDAHTVIYITPQDRQTAIDAAKTSLTMQKAKVHEFLAFPCKQTAQTKNTVVRLFWACQFVTLTIPSYMKVTGVRLVGERLFVDVVFVAQPRMRRYR